jgi:CHAT domain-containing protein
LFPDSTVVTGASATEDEVKNLSDTGRIRQYCILHFATHGIMVPQIPELSSVVLSQFPKRDGKEDGYLTMKEILNLNLEADFVNLSACETGLGKISGGEGIIGLTQSFILAGANAIRVSLWSIDDKTTGIFMARLYQIIRDGKMSYPEAVSEVKRRFIREGGEASGPFYWAPFVVYGH